MLLLLSACSTESKIDSSAVIDSGVSNSDGIGTSLSNLYEIDPSIEAPQRYPLMSVDCEFGYEEEFQVHQSGVVSNERPDLEIWNQEGVDVVSHPEPAPDYFWTHHGISDDLTMPGYSDSMPLFDRSLDWEEPTRCYELPDGPFAVTESGAYMLYKSIIEETTGQAIDMRAGKRSILGIRGSWPGTFQWNGNAINRYNDTLVVLWVDEQGRHVREFPLNTEPGPLDFGWYQSSFLRPNRRYNYINGWHRGYNAMQINEWGYAVMDDTNNNGHWDSDYNGWQGGGSADHERNGSAHNIHAASVDGPLGTATVQNRSAGCQTIPGMANWAQFLDVSWEGLETDVDYYLVDVRDIPRKVWEPATPDGSHDYPFEIKSFPYQHQGDASQRGEAEFDIYNCSTADESGPELMYVFTTDEGGRLNVEVDCEAPVDMDIHLLEADSSDACRARGHIALSEEIPPGRYFIAVDSWTEQGVEYSGPYTLHVSLD